LRAPKYGVDAPAGLATTDGASTATARTSRCRKLVRLATLALGHDAPGVMVFELAGPRSTAITGFTSRLRVIGPAAGFSTTGADPATPEKAGAAHPPST
jgi:hypothetical protein